MNIPFLRRARLTLPAVGLGVAFAAVASAQGTPPGSGPYGTLGTGGFHQQEARPVVMAPAPPTDATGTGPTPATTPVPAPAVAAPTWVATPSAAAPAWVAAPWVAAAPPQADSPSPEAGGAPTPSTTPPVTAPARPPSGPLSQALAAPDPGTRATSDGPTDGMRLLPGAAPTSATWVPSDEPRRREEEARRRHMVDMARTYLSRGDVLAARAFLDGPAAAGDGVATHWLGRTYDPAMLASWGVVGPMGDQDKARQLYDRAAKAGYAAEPDDPGPKRP